MKYGNPNAQPLITEIASSAVAVSRVQTWTVSGGSTNGKIVTVPANAALGTPGITGAVWASDGDATHIKSNGTAAGQMAQIAVWANLGTNLDDAGFESFVDNLDGSATVTYIPGTDANDIVPTSDEGKLSFDDVFLASDATGRFDLPESTPNGTQARDTTGPLAGFIFTLRDNSQIAVDAGWVVTPKRYKALLAENATDDPTATELTNTVGDVVYDRTSAGTYTITNTGAFLANKVYSPGGVWAISVNDIVTWAIERTNDNTLTLKVNSWHWEDPDTNSMMLTDISDIATSERLFCIEFEIYP